MTADQIDRWGGKTPWVPPDEELPRKKPLSREEVALKNQTAESRGTKRSFRGRVTKDVAAAFWVATQLHRLSTWITYQAPRAHSFLAAHAFGWILDRKARQFRAVQCSACPHRKVDPKTGFEECLRERCNCGKHKAANLKYKRTLAGYACVDGRFDYYGAARRWYRRLTKQG